ncbi:kinase-like domain-containing protein [Mucidula mucida]|nr:kinase-like domain-containing protein [Mucidula mucida]
MNGSTHEIFAIKRVSLEKTDGDTMSGYMNEIALLKRLEGNSRIIRLLDSELKAGPEGSKGHLLLVMECGEVDLARLLADRLGEALDVVWVAYYWKQATVTVIHDEKIVHSDLKPANFVIVKGQLKLIDFGIANAIANDTTNIHRDHQIGTVNYMSPEAIECPPAQKHLKVGRSSDIWSLGCILYQMVYGCPPFQHLSILHKMKAIPDNNHVIDFPEYSIPSPPKQGSPSLSSPNMDHLKRRVRPGLIQSMSGCLVRDPRDRITVPELFDHDWVAMTEPKSPSPSRPQLAPDETIINPHYMKQLIEYGIKLGQQKPAGVSNDWLEYDAEVRGPRSLFFSN